MPSLSVAFTAANPAPSLGYHVEYREFGVGNYIKFPASGPNPTTSPVLIPVVRGKKWEVKIKSQCGQAQFSPEQYFVFDDTSGGCYQHKVTNIATAGSATITYTNCSDVVTTVSLPFGTIIFFCARNASVSSNQPATTSIEVYDTVCLDSTHGRISFTNLSNTGSAYTDVTLRNTTTNIQYVIGTTRTFQTEMLPFGTYQIVSYTHSCPGVLVANPTVGGTVTISVPAPTANIQISC